MSSDNLANLLDALTETSVYVMEEPTHRLLYFNRRCRDISRGKAAIGAQCHTVWPELCANCPLDSLGEGASSHIVCFDPLLKVTVDVTANRIVWDGLPAVVVTATPHRLNFEEKQGLLKIKKMYAQSLVTVFDECVIANLTADYYVNCQKDATWANLPEQGSFGAENRAYARKALHPDDVQAFDACFSREAMLQQFGEGRRQISKRLRRLTGDGVYHMVEFTAARIGLPGEDACWCVLVFRDVQEQYMLEQQRNVEVSQLATAAKIAYQMLIAVNLTQNTYQMLEYERFPVKQPDGAGCFDELIDFELATVHPDYRAEFIRKFRRQALIDVYNQGERIVTMEVPHLGEDGRYHWNYTQVVRVKSDSTSDMIEITLSRNIDEERRLREQTLEKERQAKQLLEEALQKAEQASQAKSDFLSRMSHDIRTPMNAILGMTELAQQHLGDERKLRDYLMKISSSGAHLLGLINEVLDVSKIESGAVQLADSAFDLRELVRDAVELVRLSIDRRRQSLSICLDDGLHAQVVGDAGRLKQVLVNILENASKYTQDEGRISLCVQELYQQERQAGAYRFVIEDNGIGMRPAYLTHIFEPFSRADDSRLSKVAGTGLGMTIVKNLLEMMGGTIEVESTYGKGSRFTVALCLTKCDAPAAAASSRTAACDGLRVLLVEDNEINRQIAGEMLEMLGARVDIAENGREAVDAVCGHPPLYYDVVFMDVQMPLLNGYEATRAIRSSGMERIDELPILAMTADAFPEDVKQARLAGMNGHLAKPISLEQLGRVLNGCAAWKQKGRRDAAPAEPGNITEGDGAGDGTAR